MKDDPMAIFTLLLLERYPERFTGEQKDRINTWEAKLCEKSQEVQARADSSQETALVRLQQVFAEHAHRIVQLEKETLREVVMSNQARSHEAWKHAQNFFLRQFDLLWNREICWKIGKSFFVTCPRWMRMLLGSAWNLVSTAAAGF